MEIIVKRLCCSVLAVCAAFSGWSQFSFTSFGAPGEYIQDFQTFAGTAPTVPSHWANSFTDYNPGGFYSNTGTYSNMLSTYALNQDGSGEYAIGSKIAASGGLQNLTFSAQNDVPSSIITSLTISWDVEQYSTGGRATAVNFSFSGGGTINGATLTTAITGTNANLPAVEVTNLSITITDLNIANGTSFTFTWTISTGAGSGDNAHIGIDNISIVADGILPVRLTTFDAKATPEKSVLLSWHTVTETSNDFFAVERSADSRAFVEIGRERGAGPTAEPRHYTFTDAQPLPGFNYYRLRQVDFDGRHAYSRVVAVQTGRAADILVFPSPATGFLNIQLEQAPEENAVWEVFDFTGRPVLTGEIPAEHVDAELNVAGLPAGVYQLRVVAGRDWTVRQFQKM